jgi:tRNA (mo5U34)-methyltransferase
VSRDVADLRSRVGERKWYHTLELAPGVITPGWFDTRPALDVIPFPADLTGTRCLDVGTFDGFWAFEMERRGASEVVGIDVLDPHQWDWPHGSSEEVLRALDEMKDAGVGFELAVEALGSNVKRFERNVYDLDPAADGQFDFVYVGSLLLHLRDPVRALERVRSVAADTVLVVDAIDLALTLAFPRRAIAALDGIGRPWWWKPNGAGLARMVESAGFDVLEGPRRFFMKPGAGQPLASFSPGLLRHREGRDALVTAKRGDPHAAILARPR